MASIELVRLRSSDGLLFEVPSEVACLSPIVADLRELHDGDDDEEVPLPMVKGHLLAEILGLCEQYVSKGIWDIGGLRDLRSTAGHCASIGALPDKGTGASSKDSQQLERLAWVADYLGLEELMGLYLEQIAHLVEEATPEHSLSAGHKAGAPVALARDTLHEPARAHSCRCVGGAHAAR
jgi:S-phase kinase-associated protein 1